MLKIKLNIIIELKRNKQKKNLNNETIFFLNGNKSKVSFKP